MCISKCKRTMTAHAQPKACCCDSGRPAKWRKVRVIIYCFTGWQGLFKVPESWCRECDLLIRAAQKAIRESEHSERIELLMRPCFLWMWKPLLTHRAWHAPILTVNGQLVSQGVVPIASEIGKAIQAAGSVG